MIEVLIEIAGEILTTLAEIFWGKRKRKKQEKKGREEQQRIADRQRPL